MGAFPFTKKKLSSLSLARQHKWISEWLKSVYTDLLADRYKQRSFELFVSEYKRICAWIRMDLSLSDQLEKKQNWIEFVSDQFHIHQIKRGIELQEWDFLPRVSIGDLKSPGDWQPVLSYKVACDNLRSAFNVGSIFRLVDAVGFESVIAGGKTPGKDHRHVRKASMGSVKWIPQEEGENLANELVTQKEKGYLVVGLETIQNSKSYLDFNWPEKGVIVLGNEEYGISNSVMSVCDDFVHLPMLGRKNSLNVANAISVVAFHVSSILAP